MYTVKQLADLAGITVRTLHHYDAIGLLRPANVGANGYRYYDDAAVFRLQQILLYRELGLELAQIKDVLDSPDFDLVAALLSHRAALEARIDRVSALIRTVDRTLTHLTGEVAMSKKQMFVGFSPEEEKDHARRARLQYGPDTVNESVRRWGSYSDAQKQAILDEGNAIYADLTTALESGLAADSPQVQVLLERWHHHIEYFYTPTLEILRGLGDLYVTDDEFAANFRKLHPDLAEYMRTGITQYVDDLETREIERMLAEDEQNRLGKQG